MGDMSGRLSSFVDKVREVNRCKGVVYKSSLKRIVKLVAKMLYNYQKLGSR